MCKRGTTKILPTPAWLWSSRADPSAGICIDSCIADDIMTGWAHGVRTLASCCGHDLFRGPSIVIDSSPEQIELAKEIFPTWTIYQWQLVEV
jgi:hypothetical protein